MANNTSHTFQIATSSLFRSELIARKPCFHEAGHAVAAHILGFPVIWLSVDQSFIGANTVGIEILANGAGALCMTNSWDRLAPIFNRRPAFSKHERETLICYGMMLMAGPIAEKKLDPAGFEPWLSGQDYKQMMYILRLLEPHKTARQTTLEMIWKRSPKFVDDHWRAITRVSDELYLRKTLMGDDLEGIIGCLEMKVAA